MAADGGGLRHAGGSGSGGIRVGLLDLLAERLTPRRAFWYFLTAYLLGVLLLALPGSSTALLVVLPVFAYSVVLIYAQMALYTRLDTTLKDSPYFLGFLLTLTGLISIFISIGRSEAGEGAGAAVITEAAGAILATLVGLFFRQMAHSVDPGDAMSEALFESIAEEMRDQADTLRSAQARFSAMLTEFTASREEQFAREEVAFNRWLGTVEGVAASLEELRSAYGPAARQLAEDATALSAQFRDARQQVVEDFSILRRSLGEGIATTGADLMEGVRSHLDAFETARATMLARVDDLVNAAAEGATDIGARQADIATATEGYLATCERLCAVMGATEAASTDVNIALSTLAVDVRRNTARIGEDVAAAGAETRAALKSQMEVIATDVQVIDQLLTEVAELLAERHRPGDGPAVVA